MIIIVEKNLKPYFYPILLFEGVNECQSFDPICDFASHLFLNG